MKALLRKYNGQLAAALILTLIVSVSLQLVHDSLLDHHHDIDCPMFVVDGNTPLTAEPHACAHGRQTVELHQFLPSVILSAWARTQLARAPPVSL